MSLSSQLRCCVAKQHKCLLSACVLCLGFVAAFFLSSTPELALAYDHCDAENCPASSACCGGSDYSSVCCSSSQICCGTTYVGHCCEDDETCCGSNCCEDDETCCSNVYPEHCCKMDDETCCGSACCKDDEICCDEQNRCCGEDQTCCGAHLCCDGLGSCCDDRCINTTTQGCCYDRAYTKETQCCFLSSILPKIDTNGDAVRDCCVWPIANWDELEECPGTKKQRPNYAHQYDGCSVPLLGSNPCSNSPDTSFYDCCGNPAGPQPSHDQRYQTCGFSQASADTAMLNCMLAQCSAHSNPICNDPLFHCNDWAYLYYDALYMGGWVAYRNRQVEYCVCCVAGS